MIAVSLGVAPFGAEAERRFAARLQPGRGRRIACVRDGPLLLAAAVDARASTPDLQAVAGWRVLFGGQLHNRRELAAELGLGDCTAAEAYAAALARWGEAVDERCIGHYAAIAAAHDGSRLRLARSPFVAPPLHFRHAAELATASQLPRDLFWNEAERPAPDLERVAQMLLNEHGERFRGWYVGAQRLPLGCAIELTPHSWREVWRYDLFARQQQRLARREDYTEAALALLDQGVAAVLEGVERPAVMLSGGLDSASVAASVLQLRPAAPLHAFCFGPDESLQAAAPAGSFLSDFEAVRAFAAANPRVVAHFETNPGRDLRHLQRELLAMTDAAPSSLGLAWIEHALYEAAARAGCDAMLVGTWGNFTISARPPWALPEFLVTARWGQLGAALRARRGDPRPKWRQFAGLALAPLLPRSVWRMQRSWRGAEIAGAASLTAIAPDWPGLEAALRRARDAGFDMERRQFASKRAAWGSLLAEDGQEQDQYALGMELLHGLPKRDPTAYRPLVEFCWGCPTEVFMHDGEDRRLAREMGRGRLPEAQRTNRDYGVQNADWQPRIAAAQDELLGELAAMAEDPDIAAIVDISRLIRLARDLPPPRATYDRDESLPYQTVLPLGFAAARFIAYAKGRNDI